MENSEFEDLNISPEGSDNDDGNVEEDDSWLIDPNDTLQQTNISESTSQRDLIKEMDAMENLALWRSGFTNYSDTNLVIEGYNGLQDAKMAREILPKLIILSKQDISIIIQHAYSKRQPLSIEEMLFVIISDVKDCYEAEKRLWIKTMWELNTLRNVNTLIPLLEQLIDANSFPKLIFKLIGLFSELNEMRQYLSQFMLDIRIQTFIQSSREDETLYQFSRICKKLLPESLAIMSSVSPSRRTLITAYMSPVIIHYEKDNPKDTIKQALFEVGHPDAHKLVLVYGIRRMTIAQLNKFKIELQKHVLSMAGPIYMHAFISSSSTNNTALPFIVVECEDAEKAQYLTTLLDGYKLTVNVFFAIPWVNVRPNEAGIPLVPFLQQYVDSLHPVETYYPSSSSSSSLSQVATSSNQ
jgi:hypothetical protein